MDAISLQDRYAPESTCFGCGPANRLGLQIKSHLAEDGEAVVAEWQARPEHEAFAGALNGGIIGTLLDCNSNWAALMHLMVAGGEPRLPSTVTSDLAIRFLRPTPTARPVALRARVVDASDRRAIVEGALEADGDVCATSRATFVAVGPGHPAHGRW